MIITQELINVSKKIIKEAFGKVLNRLISPVIWDLLNSFSNLEEAMSIIRLNSCLQDIAIKALEIAIPQIDEWYLNSRFRKEHFYKVDYIHKNKDFLFGELSY